MTVLYIEHVKESSVTYLALSPVTKNKNLQGGIAYMNNRWRRQINANSNISVSLCGRQTCKSLEKKDEFKHSKIWQRVNKTQSDRANLNLVSKLISCSANQSMDRPYIQTSHLQF